MQRLRCSEHRGQGFLVLRLRESGASDKVFSPPERLDYLIEFISQRRLHRHLAILKGMRKGDLRAGQE